MKRNVAFALVPVLGLASLLGYILAHMIGNQQIYFGPEKLNGYAKWLHENVGLLWCARIQLQFR